ncbi:MAG: FAD-dependent oxidoreductase [Arenicellales bacterium]|nr:FAD-dependent oxidoreductase [Arenicellales bacterium]
MVQSSPLPARAEVVIVGGGIIGCSVAYHLAELGVTDVVLLERKSLTSGTTWHAAGLVARVRPTYTMTRLAQYTGDLYASLEDKTGQPTGFQQVGSLSIATTPARLTEFKRSASMARARNIEARILAPDEIGSLWPLLHDKDLVGAVHFPEDGQTNPVDTTLALASGARRKGVTIIENSEVNSIEIEEGRVTGVGTDGGDIQADHVVICAGMWSHKIGRQCGITIPLHAAEHFYIVTEPMAEMDSPLPILRDPAACAYFKRETGKLLVGFFEPVAKPWGMEGIPESFAFDSLPNDFDHLEPLIEGAIHRFPPLAEAGIQLFFNGPESFTPDDRYHLGESPEVDNLFVATGFNSIGIQSAGGAGRLLAEQIVNGYASMDTWDIDIARNIPFQGNPLYLRDRTVEALGLLYADHWPFRQFESARPVRTSILHQRLAARGACFGEANGWERPNWYAAEGETPHYEYSWGRQNWFDPNAAEHLGVRERVGLFDQSSFAKFLVQGRRALTLLNRLSTAEIDVEPGRLVYTQWLNERGGVEADLTITRVGEESFLVVTGVTTQQKDFHWLRRHIRGETEVALTDITSGQAVIGIMGPKSRLLLQGLTDTNLDHEAFPFACSREINLGYAQVRATRITYVGELGWELYIPTEFAPAVYDTIVEAGTPFGLIHAGYHTLNSLRMEKAYRHWGHDMTGSDSLLEAGLGFTADYDKAGGFIGREALIRQKEHGTPTRRLVQFLLEDPAATPYHEEPIWMEGALAGFTTSAMFGHSLGGSVVLGYVEHPEGVSPSVVNNAAFEIEIAGVRFKATASLKPMFDPANQKIRC